MNISDDEYRRLLDSLARFYNTQTTAHAGYMLATGVGVFTSAVTVTLQYDKIVPLMHAVGITEPWPAPIFITTVIALATLCLSTYKRYPFCWISLVYHFGRLQYYVALTEVVWNHMGLTEQSPDLSQFTALKKRALCAWQREKEANNYALGIVEAVKTMFEAHLYVSLRRKRDPHYDLRKDDKASFFNLSEYCAQEFTVTPYGKWQLHFILAVYQRTIKRYGIEELKKALPDKSEDYIKELYSHQIGTLFEPFLK